MAGRMGGQQVTVQNIKVLSVDADAGLVVLRGKPAQPRSAW
jgi:large subunit ribosomal protein L3